MPAQSIVRSSIPSPARISLALLLAALLVFPDLALSQEPATCTGNSNWTASGATLPSITETFGAAVSGTSSGDVMYVIGGENWNSGTPVFQTQVLHKLVSGVATTTSGTWFQNALWKGPAGVPVGFSRDLCGVVANGYLYTVGGVFFDTTTEQPFGNSTNQVWYTPINSTNGNLGAWHSTTALPITTGLQLHGAVVLNNYLYVIGGSTDPYGDTNVSQYTTSAVHYAPINPTTGAVGTWDVKSLPNIPSPGAGVYKTCPVVHNGSIYVSGGEDAGGSINQVVYAIPSTTDGSFTGWNNTSANYLPLTEAAQAVVYNDGIILMGGDGGSNGILSTVFRGTVASGGGVTWNTTIIPALPQPISRNAGATSGSLIFSLGGNHAGTDVSCIFYRTAP